jgi:hypothetical protein
MGVPQNKWSAVYVLIAYFALNIGYSFGAKHIPIIDITILASGYSASTYKEATDAGGFFTTSFGRIFCSAKNQAFRGFRHGTACRDRSAPLQSFAQRHPFGVNAIQAWSFATRQFLKVQKHISHRLHRF